MSSFEQVGAFAFGTIIGWYVYYINRYRKGEVSINDITVLIGAIGGAAVTALFDKAGGLFAGYGVGLAVGFFGYFLTLIFLVGKSGNFDSDWFLDGRRKKVQDGWEIPGDIAQTVRPFAIRPDASAEFHGINPANILRVPVSIQPVIVGATAEPAHLPVPRPQPAAGAANAGAAAMRHARFCCTLEAPPKQDDDATRVKGRAALLNAKHWGDKRRLSVGFIGGSPAVRARVARLADAWTKIGAGIALNFWTDETADPMQADIRVSFVQDNRSWSYLGTDARLFPGQPTMNLGWFTEQLDEAEARGVVLHEFGHALGLIHEHQNPHKAVNWDRKKVVDDLRGPPHNWNDTMIETNMFKRYDTDDLFATDVDPASIMMYPIPETWTKDDFMVDFNSELSEFDVKLITKAYPKQGL